jgi:hypothetical protein
MSRTARSANVPHRSQRRKARKALVFLDLTYNQRQAHWNRCREFIDREAFDF